MIKTCSNFTSKNKFNTLAEETKNTSAVNNSNLSASKDKVLAGYASYKNFNFSSLDEFINKINLFRSNKEIFYKQEIEKLTWFKPPSKIISGKGINTKWFIGSKSNITVNCVDRHLTAGCKNKAAIIWESEPGKNWVLTYQLLYSYMCRTANAIKVLGLKKRNKVCIICGSLPETIFSALACARIGVTFTILNPTITLNLLVKRLELGKFDLIIISDSVFRKGNPVDIKSKVDEALNNIASNTRKLIFRRNKNIELKINQEYDYLITDLFEKVSDECKPVSLDYKFPLFSVFDYNDKDELVMKPFSASGFMLQTFITSKYALDFCVDDIFWCNSDFSSVTGISYGIFAPLLHGISNFIYEGLPNFPSYDRTWKLISNFKITKLLTEGYIIKALTNLEESSLNHFDLTSLKLISICGNPISETEYELILSRFQNKNILVTTCFITESSANIVFSDIPGITEISSGCYNIDFPSINFIALEVANSEENILCFTEPCPSSLIIRFIEKLITKKNKKYISTNYVVSFLENKIKILRRIDNKLLIAGELVSLKEIEKVLEEHPKVESCLIEIRPDSILHFVPVALIKLRNYEDATLLLKEELRNIVEQKISSSAKPIEVIFI